MAGNNATVLVSDLVLTVAVPVCVSVAVIFLVLILLYRQATPPSHVNVFTLTA